MDKARLQIHLSVALKTTQIRRACAAIERLRSAVGLLHGLSPDTLSVLHDYVVRECLPKPGTDGELALAYLKLVDEENVEKRKQERRERYGIAADTMAAHQLPPSK